MSVARRDLRVYPKPVQDVLLQAAGVDGIEIKPLDGSHLRILNGDREVRPIKVAAQRPAEHTLRRLEPWLDTHADGWREKEEKVDTAVGTALEEAVRRKEEELTITSDPVEEVDGGLEQRVVEWMKTNSGEACDRCKTSYEDCTRRVFGQGLACCGGCGSTDTHQSKKSEWQPHVSPSGKDFGFDTNGTVYKCRECGYLKAKTQGMHLHEAKHTGAAAEWAKTGNQVKRAKARPSLNQPRRPRVAKYPDPLSALRSLADHFGMQLVPKGEDMEAVIRERDEAKARLALMKEAMEA